MKNLPKLNIQLKNLSKKKKIVLAAGTIVLIGAIAVIVSFISKRNQMKENMESVFTTETAKIERQTLTNSISATGTIESAETKTVNTSLKDLEVVALYVKEGDYVEKGTVICEFDSADYEEELAKAKNNYAVNQQIDALGDDYTTIYNDAIADAKKGLQDVRDSRDEAKEEYQNAAAELEDEQSDAAKAEDAYETFLKNNPNAEANYNSAKKAYESATSEEQAKTDASSISDLEAAYINAKSIYEKLQSLKAALQEEEAELKAAEQAEEQTKTAYEQAQEQRENYQEQYEESIEKAQNDYDKAVLEEQLITESQEEKTIDEYTELIEDCVVKAGMSGIITSLNVTEGNNFEGGDIYTIQDNEHFIVSATVDEYDIASIEKGMTAYIKTDATGDVEMSGEVTYVAIAPSSTGGAMGAVSSSASYRVEVTIADPDENLRAGMTAKLSIALEESTDALTVPYDAVSTTPDGKSTITVEIDGEQKTINIETGLETDYYTEVISDEISEGMIVYLSTPMTVTTPESDEEMSFPGGIGAMMNGRDMPSGDGNRGGNGGGGMPSGDGPGGGF